MIVRARKQHRTARIKSGQHKHKTARKWTFTYGIQSFTHGIQSLLRISYGLATGFSYEKASRS
jgi:hypothetical protein